MIDYMGYHEISRYEKERPSYDERSIWNPAATYSSGGGDERPSCGRNGAAVSESEAQ